MDCLFCKIASHEIPARIIAEDDRAIAFLDVHPRAPGHTVVIPKHHTPTLPELPDGEIVPLFQMVKKVSGRVLKALSADGLTIGINHGSVSGQTVPHLHVHVIPRFFSDGGGSVHGVVPDPKPINIDEVAKKLGIS